MNIQKIMKKCEKVENKANTPRSGRPVTATTRENMKYVAREPSNISMTRKGSHGYVPYIVSENNKKNFNLNVIHIVYHTGFWKMIHW